VITVRHTSQEDIEQENALRVDAREALLIEFFAGFLVLAKASALVPSESEYTPLDAWRVALR
jgi:hypothetical protein